MQQDIVILDGARTAIGTFGGSLAAIPPIGLAATVAREALARSGVEGGQIGQVVFGARDQHRAAGHVPLAGGGDGGRGAGHGAGDERQPAVRVGGAGNCLVRPTAFMAGESPGRRSPLRPHPARHSDGAERIDVREVTRRERLLLCEAAMPFAQHYYISYLLVPPYGAQLVASSASPAREAPPPWPGPGSAQRRRRASSRRSRSSSRCGSRGRAR